MPLCILKDQSILYRLVPFFLTISSSDHSNMPRMLSLILLVVRSKVEDSELVCEWLLNHWLKHFPARRYKCQSDTDSFTRVVTPQSGISVGVQPYIHSDIWKFHSILLSLFFSPRKHRNHFALIFSKKWMCCSQWNASSVLKWLPQWSHSCKGVGSILPHYPGKLSCIDNTSR